MKMLIGGRWEIAQTGKTIAVNNPATGRFLDTVPVAAPEDMELALKNAVKGQQRWAMTPSFQRRQAIRKYINLLENHRKEIIALCVRESGRNILDTAAEYSRLIKNLIECAEPLEHHLKRAPGIILVIVSFDAPMEVYSKRVVTALRGGSAVIVVPPVENPLTCIRLTELLLQSGIPGNVLQIITGTEPTAFRMPAGVSVYCDSEIRNRESRPFIVFPHADPTEAAILAWSIRKRNAGQNRYSPNKFIIHNSVKNEFICRLVELVRETEVDYKDNVEELLELFTHTVPVGEKHDYIGSLSSENAAKKVEKQVYHTVSQGAVLLCGGGRIGAFYMPTVLDNITEKMDAARYMAINGPVWPVIGFDTVEDAMTIARFGEKECQMRCEWKMGKRIMWG